MQSHSKKINIHQSLAQQAVLLSKEDHLNFNALCSSFQSDIQPRDAVEGAMVNLIILASWNLRRADRAEAQLANTAKEAQRAQRQPNDSGTRGISPAAGAPFCASSKEDPLLSDSKILDRIAIFRLRAERSLFKSLKELRAIRKENPPVKPQIRYELKYINPKPLSPKIEICKTNPIAVKPLHAVDRINL